MTENQGIIQHDIHHSHDNGIQGQYLRTRDTYIKSTEHDIDKRKKKPKIRQFKNSLVASNMASEEISKRISEGAAA